MNRVDNLAGDEEIIGIPQAIDDSSKAEQTIKKLYSPHKGESEKNETER